MLKTLRRRFRPEPEPTLAQALRPVLIHLTLKLTLMWLMRVAIRRAIEQQAEPQK